MVENFFASPAEELGFANLIPKSATQAQGEREQCDFVRWVSS
ncbi:hypothetical protein COO91_01794 [Nostoc flagelliforme CCNUN1]|uniref:Uncharacterized protein n=1 Tax=Nostoc flagelliforme CCNUN1 TaxID=2038116 RepID=A0A2K8SKD4_9NOSO|nr:hypothetical protein COO91_01794 [Nostoc flagelliforme CCNUN1]